MHGKRQFSLFSVVLFMATFSTVLSFYPVLEVGSFFTRAFYILWFLLLYLLFKQNRRVFLDKNILWMILAYAGCFMATSIAMRIGDYPYGSTVGIARHIPYCLFFYFVGNNFFVDKEKQLAILRAVVFGSVIVSVESIISGGLELQKNQLGQILGAAILASAVLLRHTNHKGERILCILSAAICAASLWVIQSRTPIVCLAIVFLVRFSIQRSGKSARARGVIIFAVGILAFLVAAELRLLDGVLRSYYPEQHRYVGISEALHNMKAMDILLSGRINLYMIAINDFKRHPLFGCGPSEYLDNFVLHCLRAGGIVYALLLLPLVYGIMIRTTSKMSKIGVSAMTEAFALNKSIVWSFTLFYFLESLMEGYPPIGPGASAFLLWLMLGIGNRSLKEISAAKVSGEMAKKPTTEGK